VSRIPSRTIEEALARYEVAIQDAFLKAVQDHASKINQAALIEALDRGDIDAAVNIAAINKSVLYPVDAEITNAFIVSGQSIAAAAPVYAGSFGFDGRATEAADWAKQHVGGLITRIEQDQREAIRNVVSENIGNGVNTRKSALEIAGRIGPGGRRQGGLVGLNAPQIEAVRNARADLANLDERYFTRELRDKRFDPLVKRAIRDKKPLSQVDIDRVAGRYADKQLAHRAKTIARTESLTALREGRRQGIEQAIAQGVMSADTIMREWSATMDRRTRRDHMIMDGKKVQGLTAPWVLPDGSMMMYPGDTSMGASAEQTIQCRCIEEYNVDWLAP
jgi:hypothetical protein